MPRLTSPDPTIDTLLASHARLQIDIQAYLDAHKFYTRKILPGLWQRFLATPDGMPWQPMFAATKPGTQPLPAPDDIPDPSVPPSLHPEPRILPPQDDLFDIIARGLKDRIAPQASPLDEDRVRQLIDSALKEAALHTSYRLILKQGETGERCLSTEYPPPYWFERVAKQAACRVHTLLVGPRGSGKTMTAELLASVMQLPLYTISLSGGVSEGVLQGWLHPSREGLRFEYQRSPFAKAYQEGGVVLLDELDAADPNMLMILNAALANGRWDIPLRGEDAEPLVRHPDFICIAAANTHGHGADRVYSARNQLDGATLDRFAMGRLAIDYDETMEHAAFDSATVEFGHTLRARCRAQQGWTRDVSTRNIADSCKLQQQLTLEESWYGYFEDWRDEDCAKVGAVRSRSQMSVTLE